MEELLEACQGYVWSVMRGNIGSYRVEKHMQIRRILGIDLEADTVDARGLYAFRDNQLMCVLHYLDESIGLPDKMPPTDGGQRLMMQKYALKLKERLETFASVEMHQPITDELHHQVYEKLKRPMQ